ncbi:uncharacterized protein LOC128241418 isoform X2 [Mya arenaria]|uniref:uncharacterized protein LOC128241418 isoform X2 n=1 Tax=Mya arenaria TaxID=6604 RepID=UPI0022E45021|nr:uncharacterized protein LOC128241418 isoform X2 [Mya arenaria]
MAWAIEHESQLDEFFNNSFPGRLFLMSRMFDKEISEVKRQMKEAEYKHTIKQFCLKENSVTLKHLTEDLSGVCDVQEEVDGRDEGTTYSMGSSTQKPQKFQVEDDGSSEEITYPFWGLTENPKKSRQQILCERSEFMRKRATAYNFKSFISDYYDQYCVKIPNS